MTCRLTARLDRLARRCLPPLVARADDLDRLPTDVLLRRFEEATARWRASPEGRRLQATLERASDEELIELWLQRPWSRSGRGGGR